MPAPREINHEQQRADRRQKKRTPTMRMSGKGMKRFAKPRKKSTD